MYTKSQFDSTSIETLLDMIDFSLIPKNLYDILCYFFNYLKFNLNKSIEKPPALLFRKHSFAIQYLENLRINMSKGGKLLKTFDDIKRQDISIQISKVADLVFYYNPPMRYGRVEESVVAVYILKIGPRKFLKRSVKV
jgi:hypothetical protein